MNNREDEIITETLAMFQRGACIFGLNRYVESYTSLTETCLHTCAMVLNHLAKLVCLIMIRVKV